MATFSRRGVLVALGSGILIFVPATKLIAQTPKIRFSAKSVQGKVMLAKYAEAVKRMNSVAIAQTSPRSWDFQWYIHATPMPKATALEQVYGPLPSTLKTIADKVWATCQDHFRGSDPNMFLPWHRMYLLAFEAIIRSVLNDDDFTMPYWDYVDPNQRAIPAEFRSPNSAALKSLYRAHRNTGDVNINAGDPLDKGTTVSPYNHKVLKEKTYPDFCNQLNGGLHSSVHVDVGDPTNMGDVPTAAGDPIFWVHHCNIDRLWAAWNPNGGQDPGGSSSFNFASPDPAGKIVTFRSADVGNTNTLGYGYDALPTAPPGPVGGATSGGPRRVIATSPGSIQLNAQETRVPLQPVAVDGVISGSVTSLAGSGRILLVVKNARSDIPPGTLYEVFADLPASPSIEQKRAHYLGTFSFFRASGEHMHGAENSLSFDISEQIVSLGNANQLSANPTLSIIPVGKANASAQPTVGELQLVRQ